MPFKSHNHYTPTPTKALITFNKENHRNRNFYLLTAAIPFSSSMVVENQGFTITLQMTNSAAAVFLVVLYLHFPKIFVVDWLSFTAITKTPSVLAISTFEKNTHIRSTHTQFGNGF